MPDPRPARRERGAGGAPARETGAVARGATSAYVARGGVVATLVVTLLALALPAHAASSEPPGDGGWAARQIRRTALPERDRRLAERLPQRARIAYHPGTGRVRSIAAASARPLSDGVATVTSGRQRLSAADARGEARRFLARTGALFGLRDPDAELRLIGTRRHPTGQASPGAAGAVTSDPAAPTTAPSDGLGGATVRFEQVRDGIPVMGGELVVRLADDGRVLAASGEVLPSGASVRTRPTFGLAKARRTAARWLGRAAGRPATAVVTRSEGLALHDPRIMGGPDDGRPGAALVWRIDARVGAHAGRPADHRLVLVDARSGAVVTAIGRIEHASPRRVCDARNRPSSSFACKAPFTRREGQAAVGIGDVDAAYRLMGVVDAWFRSRFGRDGIDGKGARMKATVRFCPLTGCPWRNAEWHWSAQQAVFGTGWAKADDIVAHEFVHGVLDHEARLFYHYQSGALNEAFADIFGELIDLSYPGGTDTSATRWKIGEDSPIGAFRDMKDPPRRGHPDRVRSPLWHSGPSDFGGVHRNNGVANKAAYLIAAGGTFRDRRISGIGRDRMGRIFYEAMTNRLTSAADYLDLGDALRAACADLVGRFGIRASHCKSVRDAVEATQMHRRPTRLAPKEAPVCARGKRPVDVFFDDLEKPGSGNWKKGRIKGTKTGWFYPPNPNDRPGWDGTWASSGELNLYAPNRGRRSDSVMKLTRSFVLPPKAFLRFEHGYGFDRDGKRRYDGGLVEIKLGNGKWRGVNGLFTHGGYDGRIAKRRGNPLAGRRAYTADSHGYAAARVDLSRFAGRPFKVRFRMGSDRSVGGTGWYIDDIRIYVCAADDDKPTGTLRIDDDAPSTTSPDVTLTIEATDATTWVTQLRVSNSDRTNAKGRLRDGLDMPIRETLEWDLTDAAWGGTPERGTKRVYAQVRDAAGNWSNVFRDAIEYVE